MTFKKVYFLGETVRKYYHYLDFKFFDALYSKVHGFFENNEFF